MLLYTLHMQFWIRNIIPCKSQTVCKPTGSSLWLQLDWLSCNCSSQELPRRHLTHIRASNSSIKGTKALVGAPWTDQFHRKYNVSLSTLSYSVILFFRLLQRIQNSRNLRYLWPVSTGEECSPSIYLTTSLKKYEIHKLSNSKYIILWIISVHIRIFNDVYMDCSFIRHNNEVKSTPSMKEVFLLHVYK